MNKEDLRNEITNYGKVPFRFFELWYTLVKYVIPFAIALVAFMGVKAGFDSGKGEIMALGVAFIGLTAFVSKKL